MDFLNRLFGKPSKRKSEKTEAPPAKRPFVPYQKQPNPNAKRRNKFGPSKD
jgi:hypothetical protein